MNEYNAPQPDLVFVPGAKKGLIAKNDAGRYEPFCVATVEDELNEKDSFSLQSKVLAEFQVDGRQLF